ncbi:MAG TPA: hypothetical protein VF733_05945 [Candidatus Saccharimonadales bacterium]
MSKEMYENYDLSLYEQLSQRSQIINELAAPDNPLYEAAQARYATLREGRRHNFTPVLDAAVGTVLDTLIVPAQPGSGLVVSREQMAREADEALCETAERHKDAILDAATAVGMRAGDDYPYIAHILDNDSGTKPEFLAEGGVGYASIVRRGVLDKVLSACGRSLEVVYQFGDDRRIAPTLYSDSKKGESNFNPEHKLIHGLTGDYFAPDQIFTEYEANMATAVRDGYSIMREETSLIDMPYRRFAALGRPAVPERASALLFMNQPENKGLVGGLASIEDRFVNKTSRLVIATHGYRRPVAELEAVQWMRDRGHEYRRPIVVGDVPGESYRYEDSEIVVPEPSAQFYVEQLAAYGKMLLAELAHFGHRSSLH